MYKFSYVICYRHQEDRFNNLMKTVNYLKSSFGNNIEIVLIEQDVEQKIEDISAFDKYIFTYSDGLFNRSWAFNVGALNCSSDKIFFGDCDLIIPIKQMQSAVDLLDTHGCVSPYMNVIDLNPMESIDVNIDRWRSIQRASRYGINMTGGVVGFTIAAFLKIAGWCEDFEGWGGEDDYQTWKVKNWINNTSVSGDAYHLYHPRAQVDKNAYSRNLSILNSIRTGDISEILANINESKKHIGNINKYR